MAPAPLDSVTPESGGYAQMNATKWLAGTKAVEKRKDIARKAALTRWGKPNKMEG